MEVLRLTLSLFFISILSPTTNSETVFPTIIKIFDALIKEVAPCGGLCTIREFGHEVEFGPVTDCFEKEVLSFVERVGAGMDDGTNSYTHFYEHFIANKNGQGSGLCGFFDSLVGCLDTWPRRRCSQSLATAVDMLITNIRTYVCSVDPPLLACLLDERHLRPSGFMECVNAVQKEVFDYFSKSEEFYVQWNKFHQDMIVSRQGQKFFSMIGNFHECISRKAGKVNPTSCRTVGSVVEMEFEAAIKYMDFRADPRKDALLCILNEKLWEDLTRCAAKGGIDFTTDPRFSHLAMSRPDAILEHINATLYQRDFAQYYTHYVSFSTCITTSTLRRCGPNFSYEMFRRFLSPMDEFFRQYEPEFDFESCFRRAPTTTTSTARPTGGNKASSCGRTLVSMEILIVELMSLITGFAAGR